MAQPLRYEDVNSYAEQLELALPLSGVIDDSALHADVIHIPTDFSLEFHDEIVQAEQRFSGVQRRAEFTRDRLSDVLKQEPLAPLSHPGQTLRFLWERKGAQIRKERADEAEHRARVALLIARTTDRFAIEPRDDLQEQPAVHPKLFMMRRTAREQLKGVLKLA